MLLATCLLSVPQAFAKGLLPGGVTEDCVMSIDFKEPQTENMMTAQKNALMDQITLAIGISGKNYYPVYKHADAAHSVNISVSARNTQGDEWSCQASLNDDQTGAHEAGPKTTTLRTTSAHDRSGEIFMICADVLEKVLEKIPHSACK